MTFFSAVICAKCKIEFGLLPETEKTLRQSETGFRCPFGHPLVFNAGPSEEDKLRRERDRLKQENARLQDIAASNYADMEIERRRAAAARGQVTRLKNRAANGVCPCCNRTFANLQRHMATKHAGFVAEEVQDAVGKTLQ